MQTSLIVAIHAQTITLQTLCFADDGGALVHGQLLLASTSWLYLSTRPFSDFFLVFLQTVPSGTFRTVPWRVLLISWSGVGICFISKSSKSSRSLRPLAVKVFLDLPGPLHLQRAPVLSFFLMVLQIIYLVSMLFRTCLWLFFLLLLFPIIILASLNVIGTNVVLILTKSEVPSRGNQTFCQDFLVLCCRKKISKTSMTHLHL